MERGNLSTLFILLTQIITTMPSEIYKNFEIADNLRCYRLFDMDNYGKVGMFPSTEFKSVDEIKARIDRYWKEAEEYEAKRTVDLRKSFEILMADTDESDEAREMEAEAFEERVNEYWEREFLND